MVNNQLRQKLQLRKGYSYIESPVIPPELFIFCRRSSLYQFEVPQIPGTKTDHITPACLHAWGLVIVVAEQIRGAGWLVLKVIVQHMSLSFVTGSEKTAHFEFSTSVLVYLL